MLPIWKHDPLLTTNLFSQIWCCIWPETTPSSLATSGHPAFSKARGAQMWDI